MIVRTATTQDLSDIVAWGKAKHAESNYAEIAYDAAYFRSVLRDALRDPEQCVFIARRDGALCGLLIGSRMPLFFARVHCATDNVFIADAGGDALLDAFVSWCERKKVWRIDMGMSQGDSRAIDVLMRRRGFTATGRLYFKQEVRA